MYLRKNEKWLKWVPFDRFTDIEPIGEGGFAKVFSAKWIDSYPKVALKRLNGSKNMSEKYLNEVYFYIVPVIWFKVTNFYLNFYRKL